MPLSIRLTAVPADSEGPPAPDTTPQDHPAVSTDIAVVLGRPGADASGPTVATPGAVGWAPPAGAIEAAGLTGRAAELAEVPGPLLPAYAAESFRRVLLLGVGDGSASDMRLAGAALGRRVAGRDGAASGRPVSTAAVWGQTSEVTRAFAEGALLGSYRFSAAQFSAAQSSAEMAEAEQWPEVLLLVKGATQRQVVAEAAVAAHAVALARDLANEPSNRKTPAWLAAEAERAAARSGLTVRVRDREELAELGFGGLLAVGAGSAHPPVLIELGYTPPGWRRHVVLVGKGITFDSGGLSLKPTDGMTLMKTDMAGGAAVIACMSALAAAGAAVRVTGLVPAAENMPSGSAMRPSDVITHFGGRTTEVLNTDAEGRLVLADALAYADTILRPDVMVDIATLTGAARIALGMTVGAVLASDETLARDLVAAGEASGEPLWRLPLVEEYGEALSSPVADAANVSSRDESRPGAIDAALYLRQFTGGRPWAHLDIAGAARSTTTAGERSKGATGFGTRLLLHWLSTGQHAGA